MGGCVGTRSRGGVEDYSTSSIYRPNTGNIRKNHPLCHEIIRWKSDVPLTEGQLRSKRDEFWDTAPAFEGQKEIWDALRAATVAAEAKDYELAQAILDGACISVPNGYLTECYDELGSRYQVPIYCLSHPLNIIKEESGRDSPAECSEPVDGGTEISLKLRLSHTCSDIKLVVYSSDTISNCKKKLQSQEGIDTSKQRWFYGGKLLGDKLRMEDVQIPTGYIVQVVTIVRNYTQFMVEYAKSCNRRERGKGGGRGESRGGGRGRNKNYIWRKNKREKKEQEEKRKQIEDEERKKKQEEEAEERNNEEEKITIKKKKNKN